MAADVLGRFPDAQLWAPTQRGSDNWDTAFQLGPTKCFILENKATEPYAPKPTEHKITIDLPQLIRYVDAAGAPVYYILPAPPWAAMTTTATLDPAAPVPEASRCRTGRQCAHGASVHGPFADWAYVIDLFSLVTFIASYRRPRGDSYSIPARELEKIRGAVTLDEFLEGVELCHAGGVPYADAATARQRWQADAENRRPLAMELLGGDLNYRFRPESGLAPGGRSGVLAVAVPMAVASRST
ncbi:hypothetical protein AB0K00_20625 [Dactylosporangium sp. NPDC049525]|uniref:hypothetical protein n=1 Tax=Dactylosporangium sp. NPDC049525 TaxID=3154730 RepID=UPI00342EF3D7